MDKNINELRGFTEYSLYIDYRDYMTDYSDTLFSIKSNIHITGNKKAEIKDEVKTIFIPKRYVDENGRIPIPILKNIMKNEKVLIPFISIFNHHNELKTISELNTLLFDMKYQNETQNKEIYSKQNFLDINKEIQNNLNKINQTLIETEHLLDNLSKL